MLEDFDLDSEHPGILAPVKERPIVPLLIGVVALLAIGAAVWWFAIRPRPQQVAVTAPTAVAAAPAAQPPAGIQPLCGSGGNANASLPALDESDALAKKSGASLSANPRVAAWLATDDVIRNFVVAVDTIVGGATPAPRLVRMRPAGAFRVREARDGLFIDPRSFERYAPIADAVDSIDPQSAAAVCGTLKPRMVDAYRELGRDGSLDVSLERAIVALLRTPTIGPDTRVVPKGGTYAFEDPALEELTPAQKQLARMGPRNARMIQDKLRQIAVAIGIPEDRLPSTAGGI